VSTSTFWSVIFLLGSAAFAVFLWVRLPKLTAARTGKVLLLLALFVVPFFLLQIGVSQSLTGSKQKDFCTSCHEMQVYDTSLHIDDPEYVPANHYQNRMVPQDTACYTCHTDYTLYGDIEAKFNGMKHVFVHYFGDVPEAGEIKLYKPYPNDNCLQCHRGSRAFEKKKAHTSEGVTLEILYGNQKSCASNGCHDKMHDIKKIGGMDLWGKPAFPVPDKLKQAVPAEADDPFADDPFADDNGSGAGDDKGDEVDDLFADEPATPDAGSAGGADAAPAPADAAPAPADAAPAPADAAAPAPADAAPAPSDGAAGEAPPADAKPAEPSKGDAP